MVNKTTTMEEDKRRVQIEIKLFGVGKVFKFIYDNFYLLQVIIFFAACIFVFFGITLPMFLFLLMECFIMYCQYRAPITDLEKREAFTKWFDSALVAAGGESCQFMNSMLQICFEKMFPDSLSPWLCQTAKDMAEAYRPSGMTDLNFTAMSYGYKPPKFIQVVSEQAKACQANPNSVTLTWYCIFYNNMRFSCDFKMFGIPIHLVMDDWVFYMPVETTIETPEKNIFSHLPIITAVGFNFPERMKVLNNNIWVNGFNFAELPLVHYFFANAFEDFMASLMSDDNCMVWDWVYNTYTFRHRTRVHSLRSENLFKDIAILDEEKTSHYPRFSIPMSTLEKFDEKRKTDWDRAYKAQKKLAPNETLIIMTPPYQDENDAVFKFQLAKKPCADAEVQVSKYDLAEHAQQDPNNRSQFRHVESVPLITLTENASTPILKRTISQPQNPNDTPKSGPK